MGDMALTYVLDMENDLVKIGHTENIRNRIRSIQCQSGFNVLRHHATPLMPKNLACQLENTLHGIFAKCRANGEFFRLSYEEACAALDKYAADFAGITDAPFNQELSLREKIHTLLECAKLTKDANDRQRLLKIIQELTLGDQLDLPTPDADEKPEDVVEGLIYHYCGFDKNEAILKYDLIGKLREDERRRAAHNHNRKASYVGVFWNDSGDDEEDISSDIAAFLDVKIPRDEIWTMLTKTERRKFFEHNFIEFGNAALIFRIRHFSPEFQNEILKAAQTIEIQKAGVTVAGYRFYGVRYRTETCATEIANEYYGSDARKMIYRINEALNEQVEGWQLATSGGKPKRDKRFAGVYGDQKKIFERTGDDATI